MSNYKKGFICLLPKGLCWSGEEPPVEPIKEDYRDKPVAYSNAMDHYRDRQNAYFARMIRVGNPHEAWEILAKQLHEPSWKLLMNNSIPGIINPIHTEAVISEMELPGDVKYSDGAGEIVKVVTLSSEKEEGRILLPDDGTQYRFTTIIDAIMYHQSGKSLHELSDRELDFMYAAVFNRLAYHMTREGFIKILRDKRASPEKEANPLFEDAMKAVEFGGNAEKEAKQEQEPPSGDGRGQGWLDYIKDYPKVKELWQSFSESQPVIARLFEININNFATPPAPLESPKAEEKEAASNDPLNLYEKQADEFVKQRGFANFFSEDEIILIRDYYTAGIAKGVASAPIPDGSGGWINNRSHQQTTTSDRTLMPEKEAQREQEPYNNLNYGGGFTEEDIVNSINPWIKLKIRASAFLEDRSQENGKDLHEALLATDKLIPPSKPEEPRKTNEEMFERLKAISEAWETYGPLTVYNVHHGKLKDLITRIESKTK